MAYESRYSGVRISSSGQASFAFNLTIPQPLRATARSASSESLGFVTARLDADAPPGFRTAVEYQVYKGVRKLGRSARRTPALLNRACRYKERREPGFDSQRPNSGLQPILLPPTALPPAPESSSPEFLINFPDTLRPSKIGKVRRFFWITLGGLEKRLLHTPDVSHAARPLFSCKVDGWLWLKMALEDVKILGKIPLQRRQDAESHTRHVETQARVAESTHRVTQADPFAPPTPAAGPAPLPGLAPHALVGPPPRVGAHAAGPRATATTPCGPPAPANRATKRRYLRRAAVPIPAVLQPYFYPPATATPAAAPPLAIELAGRAADPYSELLVPAPPVARRQGSYLPPPPPAAPRVCLRAVGAGPAARIRAPAEARLRAWSRIRTAAACSEPDARGAAAQSLGSAVAAGAGGEAESGE
ncbi:hypothetical protein DFH09DRAFT_1280332 [Mycena vulgaris]|nr:hypothetical protein DFH09DRAFT_1280332 [Mycena vulgaris]